MSAELTREKVGTIDFSRTPLRLKYDYRLVGLGFPRKDRGDKPGALFSIPVAPTAAHPTARTPLHPSKALPWEDCYLHTLIMVSAAVSRIHHDRPTNACIPEDELYRIIEDITEDEFTARPRPAAPPPAAEVPVDYSTPWSESTGSEVSHEDSYDVYDDGSEEEDGFEVPHYEPFVEIWEDLGVVDAPADPEDIRSELDELYRYVRHPERAHGGVDLKGAGSGRSGSSARRLSTLRNGHRRTPGRLTSQMPLPPLKSRSC